MKKTKFLWLGVGVGVGLIAWKMLSREESIDWEKVQKFVHHRENSNFVEVDGIKIHYQQFGENHSQTILLIHGYGSSTLVWKTVAPMLAEKGFNVIAIDMVGFGFSEKPSWFEYTIESQARMIVRFMNRLGIGKATVVGSSYGGAVAASLALDYPERVEKLVLVGTVCNNEPLSHPLMKIAQVPMLGEIATAILLDAKPFIKHRMRTSIAPANHDLITAERVNRIRIPLKSKDAHTATLATARKWNAERIQQDAHLIPHPTLIIWGEDDKVVNIRNAYKLYDSILHSKLVIFKNCGHIPQEEKPVDFTEVVASFIKNSRQPRQVLE
ncbi:MAG: alpha/beta hydrolase [Acidobacteria bacterium]|jgi:pimeloyl-ACP methyl ester carboxylesterase|nr:MAG: alpha/beta hydrolase [Acidobacteriota bacterium]GIU80966.1 MAG: alpha/beta hydrolase [Pyrinomonadaceae bacterium]